MSRSFPRRCLCPQIFLAVRTLCPADATAVIGLGHVDRSRFGLADCCTAPSGPPDASESVLTLTGRISTIVRVHRDHHVSGIGGESGSRPHWPLLRKDHCGQLAEGHSNLQHGRPVRAIATSGHGQNASRWTVDPRAAQCFLRPTGTLTIMVAALVSVRPRMAPCCGVAGPPQPVAVTAASTEGTSNS